MFISSMQRLSALSGVLLLSACSTLMDVPSGTPAAQIEAQFGPPTLSCPSHQPERLIWSMQPMGQYAWAASLDEHGQLLRTDQVLSDKHFALLTQDRWNKEQVLCYFGPPAEKDITPYKGVKMRVWSYRYKEQTVWNSLMYVYFDESGVVKHHHPGPDPLYERERNHLLDF